MSFHYIFHSIINVIPLYIFSIRNSILFPITFNNFLSIVLQRWDIHKCIKSTSFSIFNSSHMYYNYLTCVYFHKNFKSTIICSTLISSTYEFNKIQTSICKESCYKCSLTTSLRLNLSHDEIFLSFLCLTLRSTLMHINKDSTG